MALQPCPQCGKPISPAAQKCPHCGHDQFALLGCLILIAAPFAIAAAWTVLGWLIG